MKKGKPENEVTIHLTFDQGNQWVSYDDQDMIRHKSEYVRRMGLGGAMVWALDLDDFRNVCGEGHYPLMNTIKEVMASQNQTYDGELAVDLSGNCFTTVTVKKHFFKKSMLNK